MAKFAMSMSQANRLVLGLFEVFILKFGGNTRFLLLVGSAQAVSAY